MRTRNMRTIGAVAALAGALLARPGGAQGVIITGASSARLIDMRPLVMDSVPYSATREYGALRITNDGVVVTCAEGDVVCRFYRSSSTASLVALVQDLDIAAWGLGEGVSVHAQLRGRSAMGDARSLWPQANQSFEALSAYAELDRDRFRVRGGRQWQSSNLGFFNFDGAALLWRIAPPLTAEVYGGWTLLQGFARPVTDAAVAAVEDLPPNDRGQLIGGTVRFAYRALGSLRGQYQREIRTDRGALYNERVAIDGEARFGRGMLSGAVTRDLATGAYNELRARFALPLVDRLDFGVEAHHYVPFFELWTIWGAFAPTGFDEQKADLQWNAADGAISLGASGGYRRYNGSHTGVASLPLRTDGWRVGVNGSWRPVLAWSVDGSYGMDVGFGASRSDFDGAVRWEPSERFSLAARGAALQNIYEFRVGTGRVLGAGLDAGMRISPNIRLLADAMIYRNTTENTPNLADWNQRRGGLRLEWTLGSEPGVPAVGRPQ